MDHVDFSDCDKGTNLYKSVFDYNYDQICLDEGLKLPTLRNSFHI